jgi:hypothetical protein
MCLAGAKLLFLSVGCPGSSAYPLNLTAREYGLKVLAGPARLNYYQLKVYYPGGRSGMAQFLPPHEASKMNAMVKQII